MQQYEKWNFVYNFTKQMCSRLKYSTIYTKKKMWIQEVLNPIDKCDVVYGT